MDTKLTLKLDKDVIEKIKIYAYKKDQSVSDLVENYFKALVSDSIKNFYGKSKKNPTSVVDRLAGILKNYKGDPKEDYIKYLDEKYK